VKRIGTYTVDFIEYFKRRGCPDNVVNKAFDSALDDDRGRLLEQSEKKNDPDTQKDKVFLMTTHIPGVNTPMIVSEENWPLLGTSNLTKKHMCQRS